MRIVVNLHCDFYGNYYYAITLLKERRGANEVLQISLRVIKGERTLLQNYEGHDSGGICRRNRSPESAPELANTRSTLQNSEKHFPIHSKCRINVGEDHNIRSSYISTSKRFVLPFYLAMNYNEIGIPKS